MNIAVDVLIGVVVLVVAAIVFEVWRRFCADGGSGTPRRSSPTIH
jgi:hypothetical protein